MVSLRCRLRIPKKHLNAVACAISLLGNVPKPVNIWDHDILKANLSAADANSVIEFQKYLKGKLVEIFGPYCTYCLTHRISDGDFVLDHFVLKSAKTSFSRFTYEIKNIFISCDSCNIGKGRQAVYDESIADADAATCSYKDVPFVTFHPYYDEAGDHFSFLHGAVIAQSEKALTFLGLVNYFDRTNAIQICNNLRSRRKNLTAKQLEAVASVIMIKRVKK